MNLPPGCKPGYQVVVKDEGHEVVEDMSKAIGNFEVTVGSIESGNFKINGDRMELVIVMTVEEALNGFVYEEPYVDGKTLRIDRSDKITIPDSKITLRGLGLPKIGQPENAATATEKEDLVVIFELEPETTEDESLSEDIVDVDKPNVIKSQEDLNAYLEKQKADADLKFGRKFLKLLSRFNEFAASK